MSGIKAGDYAIVLKPLLLRPGETYKLVLINNVRENEAYSVSVEYDGYVTPYYYKAGDLKLVTPLEYPEYFI